MSNPMGNPFSLWPSSASEGGLYLLDKPEAALSPTQQLSLLVRIHELIGAESQFVIATHSPLLMAYPDASILSLESGAFEK